MRGNGSSHLSSHFDISRVNAFAVGLFLTVFFAILSLSGFYFDWAKFPYIVTIAIVLGFITSAIYQNQCPNCKRIFTKELTNKEVLHQEERPYHYRTATIYLYTDETERNREYSEEKKRMETWRIEKEHYKCGKCHHTWTKFFERNLDEHTRPKLQKTVRTHYKNPNLDYDSFS